ncbi:MAG: aldehyde dehydrogenase [Saprospiraceae bacterium]|jgi:aldehyde dehydrogenase (NAD+)|nr:aldehyde dehydrogenase [Saprospiraceae bacterium]
MNYNQLLQRQRDFFNTNATKDIQYRKSILLKLRDVIRENESKLNQAINDDFGKSAYETYTTELSFIYNEIEYFLKNLSRLTRPKKVKTNIINQLGSSKIYYEPYGCSLIIGAWNYPYQLTLVPAVCSLASGNTVVLKPSEIAANASKMILSIINENFESHLIHVIEGGVNETTSLLKERFDKIFFTGSTHVGRIVNQAAAQYLTPITLELGGKSPTIVTESADLKVSARRIVWGKYLNAGQTCIAPDYVYVDNKVKDAFLSELKKHIEQYAYNIKSGNYTRIINQNNFLRLQNMLSCGTLYHGGNADEKELSIEPTILCDVDWEEAIMQEEIFGPILPVIGYDNFDKVVEIIKQQEKPLAAYLFTKNEKEKDVFLNQISFGGGCINDTVMQISNPNLPFGGVGNSGRGNYHGKYGFLSFSHQKSVIDKPIWGEPNFRYPPYTSAKQKIVKKLQ